MSDFNDMNDPSNLEGPKLPSGINVLTILTYIGCVLGLLFGIYGFTSSEKSYKSLEELQASGKMDEMPGFMKSFAGPEALEMARKSFENRLPILILTLVGVGLCFYGALQMRKLKKQGFYTYVIGQVVPTLGAIVFMGASMFKGFALIGFCFPILFIILYATQLKHLK